ncbi:MAG: TlpA family protein disulfide reductase [bacterium]|nr:TlpA family protein disulfide reductase [bacterium]
MVRTVAVIFMLVALLSACRSGNEKQNFEKFSREFDAVVQKFNGDSRDLQPGKELAALKEQHKHSLETLLKNYRKGISGKASQLLLGKLLVRLGLFNEAQKEIAGLLEKKSDYTADARFLEIQILIYRKENDEALRLFKELEPKLKPGPELYSAYLYFSLYPDKSHIRAEYSEKFLKCTGLPRYLGWYKSDVYRQLASTSKSTEPGKTAELLKKSIAEAPSRKLKTLAETELAQLTYLGRKAPKISADWWLDTKTASVNGTGKVTLLAFWAPWCKHSRQLMLRLNSLHEKYKDRGLDTIALTRLYGTYSDGSVNKAVGKNEEAALITEYLKEHKVAFPAAVSIEPENVDAYGVTVLPTLVLIDRKGKVNYIHTGVDRQQFVRNKIKELLEEK